jgi:hypothetical protein
MIPLMENITALRKQVRHLMIDADVDTVKRLASEIGVNPRSMTMALTGYRHSTAYRQYLVAARAHLKKSISRQTGTTQ